MLNFLSLIKNEQIKLYTRMGTWSMYIILFAIMLIASLIVVFFGEADEQKYGDDWQAQVTAETEELKEAQEEMEFAAFDSEIAKNEYYLENDIKPHPYDAWQFTLENAGLAMLISLFTIIIAAGIVSNEFKWGTIKLLLIRPISRTKILFSKFVTVLLFSISMQIFLFLISLLIGLIFFGMNGLNPNIVQMGTEGIEEVSVFSEIITQYGLYMVNLIMMATFAFMISTIFRNSAMAIGLAIFLMFTGNTIISFLSDYDWAKYILFANTNLRQYIGDGSPVIDSMTLGFSITVLAVYFVIFLLVSWLSFTRRDVAGN
ncbi:ABC transporter permease subunit [Gracilibacillus kekensis]|uniref:ABC-2 type transport system permease protein n=1 Tax=Gracilibacillus kekensis TaxID=1027249 RepID=A0A1M7QKD6_9BACI|nr:ABC transporter permease subunit [Gracilibacillus kekensis]SHN31529.1 ABC-2 type transport system permease protein [Gracilibacillus kekensis]